ncbi:MAG: chromate resistance protein [Nitrospirae bacterium]|nr:chromate resistance protein [Nitrospirota bacterium]
MIHNVNTSHSGWLIFFYSVPSKPVNARMKIWRRLAKAGAILIKGAVYVLPYNEENLELCQWLVSEVTSMKGEGAFVMVDKIETMNYKEIVELFNYQRGRDYSLIEKNMEELERKICSVRKGTETQDYKKLLDQLNKSLREYEEIRRIDFFASKTGTELRKKIGTLQKEMEGLSKSGERQTLEVISRNIEDYHGKIWVTRKRPFVDRMASAWLIKMFIDKKAVFRFVDEYDIGKLDRESVTFDVSGGTFTHIGDMCTFEVLIKSFGLKDKPLKKIAEMVHELDIKDEKYKNPELKGIEDILMGIRKTAKDDAEILEKGITVFEMLYASRT